MGENQYLEKAIEAFEKYEYELAIELCTRAIEIDETNVVAFNIRGESKDSLGHYESAVEDYNRAIELDPKYAEAYNNRGVLKASFGLYGSAIEDYDQAIQLDPEYAEAYHNRGLLKQSLGLYESAIEDYDRIIQLVPVYAVSYSNRGNAKHSLGRYESAIEDHNRAIELAPHYAQAYSNRGTTKRSLGRYESAIEDHSRAIELAPDYAQAYSNRGNVAYFLGRYESAIVDYDRAIELNPELGTVYLNRAITRETLNDIQGALEDYSVYIYLSEEPESLTTLISFLRDYADVPKLGRRIIEKVPDLTETIHFLSYFETCLVRVEPFENFFSYRQSEEDERAYLLSKALVNYYLGDEGTAFKLIHQDIDNNEDRLTLVENYYYALSATTFGKVYGIAAENILAQWPLCEPADTPVDYYYLAWHYWLLGEEEKAVQAAESNSGYIPSLYQLLLFTRKKEISVQIRQAESLFDEGCRFLGDFKITLHPNEDDHLSKFLLYAHYHELTECLQLLRPDHVPKPMDEAFEIDFLQLHRELVREKAQGLLGEIISVKSVDLGAVDKTELKETLEGDSSTSFARGFEDLLKISKDPENRHHLEERLALFIHEFELRNTFKNNNDPRDAKDYYEKVALYFFLTQQEEDKPCLNMLQYLSLVYYIQQRWVYLKRSKLTKQTETALGEAFRKTSTALTGYIATGITSLGVFTSTGNIFLSTSAGLVMGSAAAITKDVVVAYMNNQLANKRTPREDYRFFREFFVGNTIESLLEIKTEGFINSESRKVLQQFYDEYRYALRKSETSD